MPSDKTQKRNKLHNNTRKRRATPMTLPELKGTFDRLRKGCHEIIRSTKDTKQRIRNFQTLWKELFHRPVDAMAAESYLRVMERGSKHRKTMSKKQKGGAALSGAPIDFQTRPGVDGVHGSFPQYLTSGLSFYNTINQEGMFKDCGVKDITPAVPDTLGSNKALAGGGPISDALYTVTKTPIEASVPPSPFQDAQNAWRGLPLGASPNASQNPLKFV